MVEMKEVVDVNTGEVRAGGRDLILRSTAIGSCVVVAAYEPTSRIGALAHIMLPGSAPSREWEKSKYAENAVAQMIKKLVKAGAKREKIEACLVGAGNVLKGKDDTICKDNVNSAMETLKNKHVVIKASAIGGTSRRSVCLDIETGCVSYTEGDGEEKLLWRFKSKN
jgi:chemotaxis protein CheD